MHDDVIARERTFHDQWAETINVNELLVRESFEAPTAIENQYALRQMGNLAQKRILDLGCGAGEASTYFALQGANVTGCDISSGLLKVAGTVAERYGAKLELVQAEAGKLPFSDESFDIVFGNGVLHHVELSTAAQVVKRVLKKNGVAVFIEPLPYNPVINVYRHLAKGVRTEDEKPLSLKQIHDFGKNFSSLHHEEFWLFSLTIFLHFFFVRRWHPSKVRYWKKIIEVGEDYRRMFSYLNRIDRWVMKYLPILKPLCWTTVLVVNK